MNKVTVIGGSGFVGTNLCKNLSNKNIDFEIIDLKKSRTFPEKSKIGDVRDVDSLLKNVSGNVIINLAAVHSDNNINRNAYYETNVLGAKSLINICNQKKIRKIIFTSTVAVYGFTKSRTDESGVIRPFNEYGKTKFEAEELLREWQASGPNSLIIVRPTVIFGEGNRGNVFNLFKSIDSDSFMMIGTGQNKKSIAYVENVSAFLVACLGLENKYALYNYVDEPCMTLNDLVRYIKKILKGTDSIGVRLPYWLGILIGLVFDCLGKILRKSFIISSIRIKKFVASSEYTSKYEQVLTFKRPFSLADAVERTLIKEFKHKDENREIFYTE